MAFKKSIEKEEIKKLIDINIYPNITTLFNEVFQNTNDFSYNEMRLKDPFFEITPMEGTFNLDNLFIETKI